MSRPDDPGLDYADPTTAQSTPGRPLRTWLILIVVWTIGLAIWALYLAVLVMLVVRFF